MTFLRASKKALFILIIGLVATPAFALAQFYGCGVLYGSTSCTPGLLHVYVVVNNSTSNFNITHQPADFGVQVHAQNYPPTTFPGSQSGTTLSVAGTYTVEAIPVQDFSSSYSQGCTGSVTQNQEATCIITESSGTQYDVVRPYPYPYAYVNTPLTCAPAYQTISLGSVASLSAVGSSGPYTWSTPDQTYQAIGPVYNTTPRTSGTYTINVYSSTQSATCTVNVVASGGPVSFGIPTNTTQSYLVQPAYTSVSAPYVSASYVPSVPNTGFEPINATLLAYALVMLLSAGIFVTPYVRKTLAAIG